MGSGDRYSVGEGGLKDRVGLQTIRQSANKGDHRRMPGVVEPEGVHFGQSWIGGPVIEGDTIGSDEYAGAVVAEAAVNKDSLLGGLAKERKELRKLRGSGIREAANGNGDEMHAERLGTRAFRLSGARGAGTQIDDGRDAEFFELCESGQTGLCATKKLFGNLPRVGNAANRQFFGKGN